MYTPPDKDSLAFLVPNLYFAPAHNNVEFVMDLEIDLNYASCNFEVQVPEIFCEIPNMVTSEFEAVTEISSETATTIIVDGRLAVGIEVDSVAATTNMIDVRFDPPRVIINSDVEVGSAISASIEVGAEVSGQMFTTNIIAASVEATPEVFGTFNIPDDFQAIKYRRCSA